MSENEDDEACPDAEQVSRTRKRCKTEPLHLNHSGTTRPEKLHSSQNSIEIAMVLSTNSSSFPSNSHVSATFSILLRFGELWNPTNCEKFNADGSLMGRTNLDKSLCKKNVRNCDQLQSDFFARFRTFLGVGKEFFWRVW